jgi:hypothetical protein
MRRTSPRKRPHSRHQTVVIKGEGLLSQVAKVIGFAVMIFVGLLIWSIYSSRDARSENSGSSSAPELVQRATAPQTAPTEPSATEAEMRAAVRAAIGRSQAEKAVRAKLGSKADAEWHHHSSKASGPGTWRVKGTVDFVGDNVRVGYRYVCDFSRDGNYMTPQKVEVQKK